MSSPEITKSMREEAANHCISNGLPPTSGNAFYAHLAGQLAAMASREGEREMVKAFRAVLQYAANEYADTNVNLIGRMAYKVLEKYPDPEALHPPDERGESK